MQIEVDVDKETCARSRQCTFMHPRVFRMGADGYPEAAATELTPELQAEAEEAALVCPSGSIVITRVVPGPQGS